MGWPHAKRIAASRLEGGRENDKALLIRYPTSRLLLAEQVAGPV
jgi:hypothetical protein